MSSREVVVFGEAIWDFFPRRAGESLRTRRIEVRHGGGAPANVARTLSRLGVKTALVTALGDDELGRALHDELAAAGVLMDSVVTVAARTAVTFVDVKTDGARSFLFYRHPSADMMLESSALVDEWFGAGWLHLGTSTLTRSPVREATERAVQLARAAGARVSLDVNARRHLWPSDADVAAEIASLLWSADVVKLSEEDLVVLGLPGSIDGGRMLHSARRDLLTILTLAERGAVAWWGELEVAVDTPALKRPVVDVTGAGDAFVAGALATLSRHFDATPIERRVHLMRRALQVGCTLGTRAVTSLGATSALHRLEPIARRIARPITRR